MQASDIHAIFSTWYIAYTFLIIKVRQGHRAVTNPPIRYPRIAFSSFCLPA